MGLNLLTAVCSEILILMPFTWGGGVIFNMYTYLDKKKKVFFVRIQ